MTIEEKLDDIANTLSRKIGLTELSECADPELRERYRAAAELVMLKFMQWQGQRQEPGNHTLERVNRLTQAVADLFESHVAQGRMMARPLIPMSESLDRIERMLTDIARKLDA